MPPTHDRSTITAELKLQAQQLGFELAGACPAATPVGFERFQQWLAAGYGGQMRYLPDRAEAYRHPDSILEGARSLLMLAMVYRTAEPAEPEPGAGRVSRYAWGADYHDLIRDRLATLAGWLRGQAPEARVRGVVDTAPLLEREFATLAGLGWIGKNTLLLNQRLGSWFFLAALATDLELEYDPAQATDHCGTCRACLDACPTGAFTAPYVLDARRCISYLTIELREPIPLDLRHPMGDWLYGCDVCQDVCPWNNKAPRTQEPAFAPDAARNPAQLAELFEMTEEEFRRRFRDTPLWRAKRRGLLRNAAIVLGNRQHSPALPALLRGLNDIEPLVRGACAWALRQYPEPAAAAALAERSARETDPQVRAELNES